MKSELLRRPILLGGLGLTAGAWLLQGLDGSIVDLGSTAVWGAIAVGSGIWWLKSQLPKPTEPQPISIQAVDRVMVEKAFSSVEAQIQRLMQELGEAAAEVVFPFQQQLAALKQERQTLRLTVLGGHSVGKTTLMQALQLNDTADRSAESSLPQAAAMSPEVTDADLVLFVTAGDLTDPEFQSIQQLVQRHQRLLLVFNKQDQYLPDDRPVVLQRMRDRLQGLLAAEDLVAASAQPAPLKVRQHLADGTVQERVEQPQPDVTAIQARLDQLLTTQVESLMLATTYRQLKTLASAVQAQLNQVRRARALPVIEQYQWIAAAAAFANPVASLDLLATASINAQMVMDLGALYQQPFSLEQAKTVTGSLASQMVKLGLVEMASQAISPLLKSHALTYVAGGTLQGISAAYLTRLVGLSLVEYFEEQPEAENQATFQVDRLVQKLKAVFQANQRTAFLQNLVKQGVSRLVPQAAA